MTDQATQTPDFAAMSAPNEDHARLEPFAGTFKAEVKMWMGPGEPMVSTGTMTNTFTLGGRFIEHDYQGDAQEGPFPDFQGKGYWGYNKTDDRYEGVWIDTASTMMQVEHGQVDASGKIWTMHGEMTCGMSGHTMKKRSVVTLTDNDHHTMEMFFTDPQGNEMKGMEINYTRV
jgi:hypothetical protein